MRGILVDEFIITKLHLDVLRLRNRFVARYNGSPDRYIIACAGEVAPTMAYPKEIPATDVSVRRSGRHCDVSLFCNVKALWKLVCFGLGILWVEKFVRGP